MTIEMRIKINTWISFIVFILMMAFLAWSLWNIHRLDRIESLTNQIQKTAYERIFLRDDYLLHRQELTGVKWKEKSAALQGLLEALDGEITREEDRGLLKEVRKEFEATYARFSTFLEKNAKKDQLGGKIFKYGEADRKLIDGVFLNAYALQGSIDRLYDSIEKQTDEAQRRMVPGIMLFVLAGGVMIALNAVFLNRTITRRISSLNRGIEGIGSGDLECRIDEEGSDELTKLACAVNDMTSRLSSSLTSIDNLQQEISLRQEAEESLRTSEALLNETGTIARIGGWAHDLLTGEASWTLGLYEVIEIAPENPIPGTNEHLDYYPLPDREILKSAYENAMNTGEPFDLELRCHTAKGRLFWARVIGRPYFSDGKCIRMAGTFQDINELKLAEEKLRRNEARYRLLAENTSDVIWTMNMDGKFTYVSPTAVRLHGFTAEEVMHKPLEELIAPDSLPVALDTLSRLLEKGRQGVTGLPTVIQVEMLYKGGLTVWTEVSGELIKDSESDAVVLLAVSRNITERKQAEEQIRKLNRTLMVLSDINQAIVRVRDLPTLFEQACRIAVEKGGFRMAWIGTTDSGDNILRHVVSAGVTGDYIEKLNIVLDDEIRSAGPAGKAAKEGVIDICRDVETDQRLEPWRKDALRMGYRSLAAFPLKAAGQIRGVFTLYSEDKDFFTGEEVALLEELAMDISFAIEHYEVEKRRQVVEEKVKNASAEWASTFDAMKDSVCLLGADSSVLRCNRAFTKMIGKTYEEIIGRKCCEMLHGGADYKSQCPFQKMEASLKREETEAHIDGRWFCIVVDPILDADGRLTGAVHVMTDITQRKKFEEVIIQTEKKYRSLFMNAREGIFQTSADGRLLMANPAMARIYGYASSEEILSQVKNVSQDFYVNVSDRDQFRSKMEADGEVTNYEVLHKKKDGTHIWVSCNAYPVYDPAHHLTGFEGRIIDITEHKRVESELIETYAKMRELEFIIDHSPVVVWLWEAGEGWPVVYVSSSVSVFGYTPDDFTSGRVPYSSIVHSDDLARVAEEVREYANRGLAEFSQEYRIVTKFGDVRWIDDRTWIRRGQDGTVTHYQGIVVDISERKMAEAFLRESEMKYRRLHESMVDAFVKTDMKGMILECNNSYLNLTGYTKEEIYTLTYMDLTPEKWHAFEARIVSEKIIPLGYSDVYEEEYRHKDGTVFPVELRTYLIRDEWGNPQAMWAIVRDITERKRAEEDLQRKHRELESAHEDLKQAQARVIQQEKMASIGQLAAGITHEINNPMSFITGNLDILRTYIEGVSVTIEEQERIAAGHLPPELLQEMQKIKSRRKFDYIIKDMGNLIDQSLEGAERVRKIVADLKTFSRMEEDVHMIEDINIGLESTINIVWNEIKYKAELVKEYGELPLTHCNISQINQVFMNLLVNAAQSIEKWGRITVKTWADEEDIYITVTDTGSGIPESNIQKIFDPFFTTKVSGKGTGLGLSISLDIVRKHRGDITLESEVGKGSTFTVRIPIVRS